MTDSATSLSPAGLRKREQILALAVHESRRRRRRRIAVKAAAVCVMIGLLLAVPLWTQHHPVGPIVIKPPMPAAPNGSQIVITRIETDPHIIERLAIPPQQPHIIMIGDSDLLQGLAEAHQPAGLAYVNGKPMLLFR